jgi:hypothetical protein
MCCPYNSAIGSTEVANSWVCGPKFKQLGKGGSDARIICPVHLPSFGGASHVPAESLDGKAYRWLGAGPGVTWEKGRRPAAPSLACCKLDPGKDRLGRRRSRELIASLMQVAATERVAVGCADLALQHPAPVVEPLTISLTGPNVGALNGAADIGDRERER